MSKYILFWLVFLTIRALHKGNIHYRESKKLGYNKIHFEQTGKKIIFNGSIKEEVSLTLVSALGLLFYPAFIIIETIYFLPAALVLYLIQ